MKNSNGSNNNLLKVVLLAILPIVLIAFVMLSNRTVSSQGGSLLGTRDSLTDRAVAYYLENSGEDVNPEEVEAVKRNFGCHFEIYVYYQGELEMRLSYSGGRFYEI